jgi:hypothetical protein
MPTYPVPIEDANAQSLVGQRIGGGGAREVFEVKNDSAAVIKVAAQYPLTNFIEWLIWNWVRETHWRSAFGECHTISPSGRYLIMERLDDVPESRKAETPTLPSFVGDVWANNFGVNATGVIKARDYASANMTKLVRNDSGYRRAWQEQVSRP